MPVRHDGFLADTAQLHARAWKQMFNAYLLERGTRTGEALRPFDTRADYEQFADGKPHSDSVRSFLAPRGIELPPGAPAGPTGRNDRRVQWLIVHVEHDQR